MNFFAETWRALHDAVYVDVDGEPQGAARLKVHHFAGLSVEEDDRVAQLAAAAPEMYRALKAIDDECLNGYGECPSCSLSRIGQPRVHDVDCALAAALKKAEGR